MQGIQANIKPMQDVQKEIEVSTHLEIFQNREEQMRARSDWIKKWDRKTNIFKPLLESTYSKIESFKSRLRMVNGWKTQKISRIISCNSTSTYTCPEIPSIPMTSKPNFRTFPSLSCQMNTNPYGWDWAGIDSNWSIKAPRPYGIPAAFYQHYWSFVQTDIVATVKAFFHSGYLLKSLNHTFLTLIPKVSSPEEVSQYRSISLCNVAYKIISKVIVYRLKPIMDSLITPFQNAFIQGRLITDNILLAHEIYDYMRKKKKKR